jgi:hypothetical protein
MDILKTYTLSTEDHGRVTVEREPDRWFAPLVKRSADGKTIVTYVTRNDHPRDPQEYAMWGRIHHRWGLFNEQGGPTYYKVLGLHADGPARNKDTVLLDLNTHQGTRWWSIADEQDTVNEWSDPYGGMEHHASVWVLHPPFKAALNSLAQGFRYAQPDFVVPDIEWELEGVRYDERHDLLEALRELAENREYAGEKPIANETTARREALEFIVSTDLDYYNEWASGENYDVVTEIDGTVARCVELYGSFPAERCLYEQHAEFA